MATYQHLVITIYRVHTHITIEPTQELIVTSDKNPDGISTTGVVIINIMLSSCM